MRTAHSIIGTVSFLALGSVLGACSAASTDTGSNMAPISSNPGKGTGGSSTGFVIPSSTATGPNAPLIVDPNMFVGPPKTTDCDPKLIGIVRDFNSAYSPVTPGVKPVVEPHPDFETFLGDGITPNLVMHALGANGAPVYADPQPMGNTQLTSAANFALWYSTDHPAGSKFELDLNNPPPSASITKSVDAMGATTYESESFFPIDGKGTQSLDLPYGENKDAGGTPNVGPFHNYHFTFELNTKFIYRAGQVFSFFGDDDLWVFIDKKLAVDVGGLHPQAAGSIALDTLGLTAGLEYELSVFHAERRATTSNFKATTNITFSNCNPILR